jgi:uncharacterized protein (DUF4213/DUF364 family)
MPLLDELLAALPDGQVDEVRIGLHWTAVVAVTGGQRRCGLASTLSSSHEHTGVPDVPQAGCLHALSGLELAHLAREEQPLLRSVGVAAINALLPRLPDLWVEQNAEEVIASQGIDKLVALVGRFPFISRLKTCVGRLVVLEQQPRDDERPVIEAPNVLPQAEIVAITGMAFVNHTLEGLLALCSPRAQVLVLGPSTPLSPILANYGVTMLSGAIVEAIEPVLKAVEQGANFRQVHQAGVKLVTMARNMRKLHLQ